MNRTYTEVPASRTSVRLAGDPDWSDFPSRAGRWWWKPTPSGPRSTVEVTETHAGGRLCKALKMGGSSQCVGFADWSGYWCPVFGKAELTRAA